MVPLQPELAAYVNVSANIPDKKRNATHRTNLKSQKDHKRRTSFMYIISKVCQLLLHNTSFETRGQNCVKGKLVINQVGVKL